MITEEGQFDAHIGISPSGSVHLYGLPSILCSMCSESINFKISKTEFDKLKKLLHPTTYQKAENHERATTGETGETVNGGQTNVRGISDDQGGVAQKNESVPFY